MAWWNWLIANKAFSILLLGNIVALLNGIVNYVPAGGFRTDLEKFVMVLRWILDRVAPTTAKDSPGTFKLPFFQWSKPPANGTAPAGFKQAGFATSTMLGVLATLALIATLLIACISIGGCAWWSSKGKPAVVDCGSSAVKKFANDWLSLIAVALDSDDYAEILQQIVQRVYESGIANAVEFVKCVVAQLDAPIARPATMSAHDMRRHEHAQNWLAMHQGRAR